MKSRSARAGIVGTMAVGAVVAVTSFGAPGGAQSDTTTNIAHPGFDFAPAISDDGRTIVFTSSPTPDGSTPSIHLHERGSEDVDGTALPATTTLLSDSLGGTTPAISGNGCIVTWSVPPAAPAAPAVNETEGDPESQPSSSTAESSVPEASPEQVDALQAVDARFVVLDRCADPSPESTELRVDLPVGVDDPAFGPAVPSLDGSVIAVSNGTDVVRFARDADGGYQETHRFDGSTDAATDHLVARRLDVSDDGSVVVFAGGSDLTDVSSMSVFAHVVENGEAATSSVLATATAPSVSGDGTFVVAATGSEGAQGASVTFVDRTAAPLAPVDLGPGQRPAISADGNHVVLEDEAELVVVSRVGQGTEPFATTQRTPLSSTIAPTRSGPVIDRLGRTVANDLEVGDQTPPADTDIAVTDLGADASFDAAVFDLGRGDVGAVLTSTITFSNRGPASIGVESLMVDGPFTIAADRCGSVVRPGTTCEVDVSFTVERAGDAAGQVTLVATSFGVAPFVTEVRAVGEAQPVTTPPTSPPTTRPSGSSTGGSTGGTTSTGGSGRNPTTTTTTTTLAPGAGVRASPATFDFAPTIVEAGRRTGLVEIINDGSRAVTVSDVRLDPAGAGPFEIVETTCRGESLAAGSRCGITISFAPTIVGVQNVTLIASLASGVDITAVVSGTGAPTPTLEAIPGVATVGQVVTLRGSGFPTGVTVEVTSASSTDQVVVDETGTFDLPVIVMSHTPTGPVEVSVAGQTDLFGTVTGTLLVTDTSDRSRPSVIEGIGPSIGR